MSTTIQAVFFDAVGTLIHPRPGAVEVYARIGREFGSRLDLPEIAARFRRFFQVEEENDGVAGWKTNEERERSRWRNIVAGVLEDVVDGEGCFAAIYDHFAKPQAWSVDADAGAILGSLKTKGCQLGLASNYDHRLHSVVAGLEPLGLLDHVVISSEVGWRKPAPEFFAALSQVAQAPADAILFVGDDLGNDYHGAKAAGLRSILLDPAHRHPSLPRIATLSDLIVESAGLASRAP